MAKTISNKLIRKLSITFLLIIVLAGGCYIGFTVYFYNRYFEETTQKLNMNVSRHLIQEKFEASSPFLADGTINKALFGDIMHDMMAVNRGIEVYLLDTTGLVLYSVVLDHDSPDAKMTRVDIGPIKLFTSADAPDYILGDDPRDLEKKKIFSAAYFENNGRAGYIYIILAGHQYEIMMQSLWSSYFLRLGITASILTVVFSSLLGLLAVWYLTKNLREIIFIANRFKEGDLKARIANAKTTDLNSLATTFNAMADTIVENMDKLQSVERLRRELIANVSHDLRTPLSILQGYVETLRIKSDSLSNAEQDQYLEIIENSAVKLGKLVSQLFEYSKLEANQITPQKEPFQITELVSDIHANYQLIADRKKIELSIEHPNNVPFVFADISLVERAIQNLIDNAVKFTPKEGKIVIAVQILNQSVSIAVKDSGPGIPPEDQKMIFDRYRQAKTGNHKSTGAGLGLAIVRKIMEIHNSTIEVISKPNQGTTFQFFLQTYPEAT